MKFKKFEVSFPYSLEYPIKVVIKKINLLGFFGWIFQKYGRHLIKPENILITERIVEIPSVYLWLGQYLKNGDKILEIGHVNSSIALELATLGYNVSAIDLRDYPLKNSNLKSIRGDFLKTNFDDKFNCIFSISTIEHFGENKRYGGTKEGEGELDRLAFDKISRLLEENGRFILTVPYATKERADTWFKTYTRGTIEKILSENFIIEDKKYFFRNKNQWLPAEDIKNDPEYPYDGVALFLMSKKAE